MNKTLKSIMGIYEDKREPATVHFLDSCKCTIEGCEDRGKYTNCYFIERLHQCYIYEREMKNGK